MPSMDESWEMRNGLVIPNRSVLAAMTNKQSHADGTLSDEEMRFWYVVLKVDLGSLQPQHRMCKNLAKDGKVSSVYGAITILQD